MTGETFSAAELGLIKGAQDLNAAQSGTDALLAKQLEISMQRETRAHDQMVKNNEQMRIEDKHQKLLEVLNSPVFVGGIMALIM